MDDPGALCHYCRPPPSRTFLNKKGFHEILNLYELIRYNEFFFQKPHQKSQKKTNLQYITLQGLPPAARAPPT